MTRSEPARRVYVRVRADFSGEGVVTPLEITWRDGRVFPIDRVTDVRQAAAMKAGGQGDRYTVRVLGRESYLFFERSGALSGSTLGRWFVEEKNG